MTAALEACSIPHSPITPIEGVPELSFVQETALSTVTPDGKTVRLPPPAVPVAHLDEPRPRAALSAVLRRGTRTTC